MKSIKKIICMLFMLVLSVVNVSAAEKGTITINKAIVNESYNIYKVLDLETYDKVNNHYIYRAASGWETFLDGATDYLEAKSENGDKYYVWKDGVDKSKAKEFAEKAYKYAKDNNITPTMTKKATSTSVVFDNLDLGYYLVDSSVGALLHLTTTNPSATVNEKNTLNPNVDKNVLENSTGKYGKENDDMIGSTISYKTTITTGAGYGNYVLYDVMDKGLTFNVNSVEVKIGDEVVESTNNYTVKTDVKGYTFVIEFTDEFILKQPKNTNIDVYYTATLNKDAVVEGKGNVNETYLEYGNKTETDHSKTTTYTYAFDLVKTNKEGKELTGAEFILLDNDGKEIKVVLKDKDKNIYRIATGDEEGVNIKVGHATIEGLDKDSYKLKEVVSPEGYNKLTSPVEFTVNGKTSTTIERPEVNVINYTGSELPETGGIGTKLFITSGLTLVLICGLVLVKKLRLYKNI